MNSVYTAHQTLPACRSDSLPETGATGQRAFVPGPAGSLIGAARHADEEFLFAIAGADCGFASFAATVEFMPEIVWAKLEALAECARRASDRLWS
jgi:hypothetical protein